MALPRNMLKQMGLTEEQIELIVDANAQSIAGLTEKLAAAEARAKAAEDLQKKVDELSAEAGYREKFEREHAAFEHFKSDVAAEKTKAAKEQAAKGYFESKNITGKNLAIALRGAKDEIAAIELNADGSIKDTKPFDDLVSGEYSGLVVKSSTRGANTATPPGSVGAPDRKSVV